MKNLAQVGCRAYSMALLVCCVATAARAEPNPNPADGWKLLQVPGVWETQADKQFAMHDGFAWYRCYVAVPGSWVDFKLYADSLVLAVSGVSDAHEAYLNGAKLGVAGSLPPEFKSGVEEVRRHKIPPDLLKKDVWNVIAIRVWNQEGPGGFQGPAPVVGSYEHEIKLAGDWEFRHGDNLAWAAKATEQKPATAVFDAVVEASSPLAPTGELFGGPRLSPDESLAQMKAADDLALDQVLAEPLVAQPLFMNFDARGRMWVVQYRQYPYPAGLQMMSRNKYYRAVYDTVPLPPPNHPPGRDVISIHEDSNGDGVFDKHKTFLDGLNIVTSVTWGRGGAWVLQPPYLLFYPDANGDDVPDADPVVHLSGFGLEDTHSATNSLSWGPDGWLYSTQGCNTIAHIKVRGNDRPVAYMDGPGVWRYHPEQNRFEVFAEGGGNAFGMEIDSQGRIYSGHNGSNTRGFYYVQGGYYDKGVEAKFMPVSNLYAFGTLPMMAHAVVPRFTHAFVSYEGDTLPAKYHDKLFCVDPLNNNVMVSSIAPQGASFETVDLESAISSGDRAFRPVAIAVGPDGGVYVADFYEYYIAHGQHYQGQIDPTTGRIYRLRAKDAHFPAPFDLQSKSSGELVDLLSHANKWHRQAAQRLLADRRDSSILPRLRANIEKEQGQLALESLWALYQLGGFDESISTSASHHDNPSVQIWAVRLLGDARHVTPNQAKHFVELTKSTNAEVLCQLAATARRLPAADGLPIVRALMSRGDLASDAYLPLMIWWALESKCGTDRAAVLALFDDKSLWERPLVKAHILSWIMRRFASAGSREDLLCCAQLVHAAPEDEQVAALTRGFEDAYKGRSLAGLPDELIQALKKTALAGSLPFRVRLGDSTAIDESLETIGDANCNLAQRIELVAALAEVRREGMAPILLGLLDAAAPDPLRIAALAALQHYSNPEIGVAVVERYGSFSSDAAAAAQTLLVSRPVWTRQLLEAIAKGQLERGKISADAVRKALLHTDPRIQELVQQLWGEIKGPTNDEMRAQIQRLLHTIRSGTGDPYAGRKLYDNNCGKCHMLFGLGGKIGPDLTLFKRDDLPTMLINIVNPSAEIREGYEMYVVATTDGRILTGFLAEQDKRIVSLRTQDGQTIAIAHDEIEEMTKQPRSLMPENVLSELTDQQLRDLFGYLRSSQPGR